MKLLHTEMQAFVSESQQAAELEEKRRYRFLAEKHHLLSNTFLQFYARSRGIVQNKSPLWKEQLEASRNPISTMLSTPLSQGHPSGRLTPTHLEMPQRPVGDFSTPMTGRSSSPVPQETVEILSSPESEPRRRSLPRTSSAGSLSTSQRSCSGSFGEQAGGGKEGGSKEENSNNMLKVRAIAPHSAGSNRTLLQFSLGDIVIVLIPEAQNGWLYGRLEGTTTSGWFPEAFVKPLEEMREPEENTPRSFPLRSSNSVDELMDRSSAPSTGDYWHTPTRPQSPNPSPASVAASSRRSSVANAAVITSDSKGPFSSLLCSMTSQPDFWWLRGSSSFC
uniref:Uncharacterized protein n=1 Tax=Sphaerodactylus townsendi TaxID=933632 RepID=A0ACB8FMT6_9SAUR